MNLKISKPLCFFDLETTGINVSSDRIVEISVLKIYPNGNKESRTWLVNPELKFLRKRLMSTEFQMKWLLMNQILVR